MNGTNNKTPKSSLVLFTNMISAVAAILVAPYITEHVRNPAFVYLNTSFDATIAYWGSWLVVVLLIGCCHSGLSTLLQVLVFKLAQPRRDQF